VIRRKETGRIPSLESLFVILNNSTVSFRLEWKYVPPNYQFNAAGINHPEINAYFERGW